MKTFLDHARSKNTLSAFGDSMTAGASISESARWANLFAGKAGLALRNKGISGTLMQGSPDASGMPRAENGVTRYQRDLLGKDRSDLVAILYGCNDARYVAAPATINRNGLVRDYTMVIEGLLAGGFDPSDICIGSPFYVTDEGFGVGGAEFSGQSRAEYDRHVDSIRAIATRFKTFYAPVNEATAAQGGALILPDKIHPSAKGHAVIAAAFASAQII
ncbi:SGNH/GDSL hydrolase family protein [Devosia sp. XJ19-1]|uniref:SGNH/GDSL hydrolase family protein n=1 Tax=Devosia ureilytica TaxID=2952754 RepID=A0A9Q4FRT9_9HYPH|nr:SGNH/GDSL hydrolase family protein [Devosia ureilytica]MCP8881950.1 SGNH/GDSL hydrolase family protein [Devosia ureilytica]MCP8886164.1 SGNH/GDSL hydrolase family protein [Devosia ureilytica]